MGGTDLLPNLARFQSRQLDYRRKLYRLVELFPVVLFPVVYLSPI